jgi:ABC-type bacteriocin/lantibiotic exporter with double-glycine peptidase domain
MRVVPVAFLFLLYGLILLYQSWEAFVGLVGFILLTTFSLRSIFRKSLALGHRQQEESRNAGTHFIESLGGLRTVRSFTAEHFIISRHGEMMKRYMRTLSISEAFSNLNQIPIFLAVMILLLGVLIFTDSTLLDRQMPTILAGIMIFFRLLPIANQGLENALRLTANLRAGRNVADMLCAADAAEQIAPLPDLSDEEKVTSIEFDRVTFRYAEDTPKILDNFSLELKAGKSYAITGPSGIGKSSLIDLMLKFYTPLSGAIRMNGKDITRLSDASVRRHILLSEQTTRIFYGTVLENVRFGQLKNDIEARDALTTVGLQETLDTLPQGAETVLSFQGSNLSGGQRQRVGIARALARTADVLVMDESTNALDSGTRERVLKSILDAYRDGILIFVTHDPQVISRVDEVIELRTSEGGSSVKAGAQPPSENACPLDLSEVRLSTERKI